MPDVLSWCWRSPKLALGNMDLEALRLQSPQEVIQVLEVFKVGLGMDQQTSIQVLTKGRLRLIASRSLWKLVISPQRWASGGFWVCNSASSCLCHWSWVRSREENRLHPTHPGSCSLSRRLWKGNVWVAHVHSAAYPLLGIAFLFPSLGNQVTPCGAQEPFKGRMVGYRCWQVYLHLAKQWDPIKEWFMNNRSEQHTHPGSKAGWGGKGDS